ncbi:MAG: hypothetical protein AAF430_12755 [Myxococcota bacterium]
MNPLYGVLGLAALTALGHSYLSETLFLRPLRAAPCATDHAGPPVPQKLLSAMFHLPSLFWVGIASAMLFLDPSAAGYRVTLWIFAGLFAVSALGNFWAVGRVHPGGLMLASASALTVTASYA